MNKKINIFLAIIIFLFSCSKKSSNNGDGECSVLINGTNWSGKVRTFNYTRFAFGIDKYKTIDGVAVPFEHLGINLIPKKIQYQNIYKKDSLFTINSANSKTCANFGTSQGDGDVSCDGYEVLESDSINNWIRITKQENDYAEINGEFSITFLRTYGCSVSPYTDTLRMRNGTFHIYLR